jgi:glutathione S-transferase
MAERSWVVGDRFSLADCAAAPALFYAAIVMPFPETHARLAAYFDRLMDRASIKRVIAEARPYFHLFPYKESIPTRFLQEGASTP